MALAPPQRQINTKIFHVINSHYSWKISNAAGIHLAKFLKIL